MGVVNVTPDSFYDGGRHTSVADVVSHAQQLWAEGADSLDVGGESSRPGSKPISLNEELARVVPVLEALQHAVSCAISIDTTKAVVAEKALHLGASIVNDVSGLRGDARMAAVLANSDAKVVIMHAQGSSETMQQNPLYHDVVQEVGDFFDERLAYADKAGIRRDQVILDPGIGFGKSPEHNLLLLHHLDVFCRFGCAVMVGVSRKRFVSDVLGVSAEERLWGTLGSQAWAVHKGATYVRVHDVRAARGVVDMWRAIAKMEEQ